MLCSSALLLYDLNFYSEEDGYLSRLQQDREELLQMQQQGREGGGERLEQDPDAMFDNNQDFNGMH